MNAENRERSCNAESALNLEFKHSANVMSPLFLFFSHFAAKNFFIHLKSKTFFAHQFARCQKIDSKYIFTILHSIFIYLDHLKIITKGLEYSVTISFGTYTNKCVLSINRCLHECSSTQILFFTSSCITCSIQIFYFQFSRHH